jgi:hypothetical protein
MCWKSLGARSAHWAPRFGVGRNFNIRGSDDSLFATMHLAQHRWQRRHPIRNAASKFDAAFCLSGVSVFQGLKPRLLQEINPLASLA